MNPLKDEFPDLHDIVSKLPRLPGVYLMRDKAGELIYVGKARDLRARVKTYFAGGDGRSQISFLLKRIHTIDKILTEDEEQALILERDLINKHKPRYNIRLKDDKNYINVRINRDAEWPRLELTRKVDNDGAVYFGPYTGSLKLYGLLEVIRNVVPLRSCSDTVFYNRQRPCLEYQIKRCAGPCCLTVDREQYGEWVDQAISMLQGKLSGVLSDLNARMERASENLQFEEAAILRDRIAALDEYASGAKYVQHHAESRDVFSLHREGSVASMCIMRVRNGRVSDSETFSFTEVRVPDSEVIESAILQFYDADKDIPDEIIVPQELEGIEAVESVLSKQRGSKVSLSVPKRGSKLRLLQLAYVNAEHAFAAKFNAEDRYQEVARELSVRFSLKQVPRRIECVDISNLQGSDIVGALVCFYDGVPDKSGYRRYKIKIQGKPDDFRSIHEVVARRLSRAKDEDAAPDLLIIDGGAGQLQKAIDARDELGLSTEIIALAKERTLSSPSRKENKWKPERVFVDPSKASIALAPNDALTHFLQRVRDEAHRFVITFHRNTRARRVIRSVLDELPGLGPERRGRLLRHFGSVKEMKRAEVAELARVGRMPASLAAKVKSALQRS